MSEWLQLSTFQGLFSVSRKVGLDHNLNFSQQISLLRCLNDRDAVETRDIVGILSGILGSFFTIIFLIVIVISFKKMFKL